MADCGRVWTNDDIAALLAIWSDESVQSKLNGMIRNKIQYLRISEELTQQGY